jgi:hypothetical protein
MNLRDTASDDVDWIRLAQWWGLVDMILKPATSGPVKAVEFSDQLND